MASGIGIDVSKDKVDVADSDGSWRTTFTQTAEGLGELAEAIAGRSPNRVVVEASGGYERAMLAVLHAAAIPVVLVQPSRARSFARAIGENAKTDRIDARVLARMALMAVDENPLWAPLEHELADLCGLVHRRHQLVVQMDAERKRRRGATTGALESIERMLRHLEDEKRLMEREINALIARTNALSSSVEVMESVDGVGRVTAATLLVTIPELGTLSRKEIAALAGVAPLARDSGQYTGQRYVKGGRVRARNALYMAALVATRHNPHIKQTYARLRARGKPAKVALVACMRKLLIHLNTKLRIHAGGQTVSALVAAK